MPSPVRDARVSPVTSEEILADYRLYLLDLDGRIMQAADLEADDDEMALAHVRHRRDTTDIELWCGKRKVARIPRQLPGDGEG